LAKAVAAFYTGGHYIVRMAAVAACFFKGKAHSLSPCFQLLDIVYLMGEITWAITAINAAYPNQFPLIFFHTGELLNIYSAEKLDNICIIIRASASPNGAWRSVAKPLVMCG